MLAYETVNTNPQPPRDARLPINWNTDQFQNRPVWTGAHEKYLQDNR